MTKKNYYSILGINEVATEEQIRTAYKKLALIHHPDKGGSEEKMKELNEAYEILSDKIKRANYDKGENVSVEKYGYDYGEEIPTGESALGKYLKIDN